MAITAKARLPQADGELLLARNVRPGHELLGMAEDGRIIPARVLEVEVCEKPSSWVRIAGPRVAGNGRSSFYSFTARSDTVLVPTMHTSLRAEDVLPGMELRGVATSLKLGLVHKSVLLGILLGDGTLKRTSAGSTSLVWSHSEKQADYLRWTVQVLSPLAKLAEEYTTGYGSRAQVARTIFHPALSEFFDGFDKPKGVAPSWIESALTPIALAYWYMDDGALLHSSNQQDRAHFSTYSFSEASNAILQAGLLRLGIASSLQLTSKGPSLRVNAESADLLFSLIAPYVPPSLQYKLPSYYRGNSGWLPKSPTHYKGLITNRSIDSVEHFESGARAYHFVTETGNAFAQGLLFKAS